ncbi:MAG: type II toxin-antitoxin system VapC family toxin [Candidatus Bathyarchaeia archaeon]|nr:type II toxin-antitoxin system VapC family toxin [Candidatus Bathyarchaeia archaeon]
MKFLDANVFIYAYYKPKRQLSPLEKQMKEHAKKIISDVSHGKEEVLMTVVHLSEVINILKHGMPLENLSNIILGLFMLDNVKISGVSKEAYFGATEHGEDLKLDPNDALAVDVMRSSNINEIYSFDEDFDKVEGIKRLPIL